ncbi:M48 family metallopeptidase [Massilia horti]|uniref:M48 family peptidase n=1 Tax=Massilia horti TaxID=2562153 RepID=A0A4Y9T3N1_9BURK|nr:M48 family metallopeptidase [Massilia horti]TFW32119.1 M48 family peptidase [Massilia horti]
MNRLKRAIVLLTLCACVGAAPAQPQAQEQVVQDGIAVRPLSRWRVLAPETAINQQSAQQYKGLLEQAREKGALVPATHPEVQRLRRIADRLIPFTPRWNPAASKWKWEVNLLNSSQVNAFCMPGGRIAFFTGILSKLKLTDDEIAAVMGHEIAHALREHGREQMGKSTATSIGARLGGAALSAWLGIDPRMTDQVTGYAGQLMVLKFSRDDEREADLVGLDLAARAGFDPRAGVALWRKMAALNQQQPIALFSTHPLGPERIAQIENHMNVLLPLYARAKGTSVDRLPPYRTNVALR